MTYAETLEYLYAQLPMFTRIGAAAYKKDLHNTLLLSDAFDHPEKKFRSLHVAGTNGKGSCSHMLAAIFQAAGYKTGLYTSPHLKDFRERIKINGAMISQEFVVDFTQRSVHLIGEIEPSFFELTVIMAFEYFATEKVDIAIIETGLGGRLDSTNIIMPELSVITNIGMDHMNILGNTLAEIAFEKAGIIKPKTPIVIGESLPETRDQFLTKARKENAPLIFAEDAYLIRSATQEMNWLHCEFQSRKDLHTVFIKCDLPGIYQKQNLRTVLTALDLLRTKGFDLPMSTVAKALEQVKASTGLHGRWEMIHERPYVILDVAHNEDGILQVLENTALLAEPGRNFSIVIGMVKDKEIDKVLALLPASYRYYFTNAHLPRALPAVELKAKANQFGLAGEAYDLVNDATAAAISAASANDVIIVCGSVFVIGELDRT